MKRVVWMSVGTLLLLLGAISMVTPIPGGTFMLAAGAVVLICASPWFRGCLQYFRGRFTLFNRIMTWLENKTGERIGSILRLTQPGYKMKPGDHGARYEVSDHPHGND